VVAVRPTFVAVVGALACGCVSGNQGPPQTAASREVTTTEDGSILRTTPDYAIRGVINLPLDEAYAAMMVAYARLGIEATTNDSGGHVVGTTSMTVVHRFRDLDLSRYFECGRDAVGAPRADRYRVTFSAISTLSADGPSNSKVETLVTAKGSDPGGNGSDVYCSTTGRLEADLIKATK
jgi:hypothetical protein